MHKRPGASIAGSSSSKKVRFDAHHPNLLVSDDSDFGGNADVDALFEADIAAPHAHAARRHAVKLDGYSSDSSDDQDEKRVASRDALMSEAGPTDGTAARVSPGLAAADEDEDMFAEEPSSSAVKDKGKGKAMADAGKDSVRFLALDEIPGQEFEARHGMSGRGYDTDGFPAHPGHYNPDEEELGDAADEEDEEDDGSVDEEVGALGRKHNAPKMDAFNMKAELEHGQFDTDGNYIRQAKDVKDSQDVWLKDVSKRDIAAAREAMMKRQAEEEQRLQDSDEQATVGTLLGELVSYLEKGETLLEALQRFGVLAGSRRKKSKKAAKRQTDVQDVATIKTDTEQQAAHAIERLTLLASKLMGRMPLDLYELEREGLTRAYQRETGEILAEQPSRTLIQYEELDKQYEFRYQGTEEVYGPYGKDDLLAWQEEGQFAEHACEVRLMGTEDFTALTSSI
ncbi:hypothetical protein BCR37DRAFT_394577 [Protomyces lactucae-debilis]|uniref:GYF domain-containing protein n=1 Tax=Protomyces lactucae-debilis TaxID=2754530 RepID=A0A1Y2F413_PROLT|nr:uncharacterized protein BCR37DRAFT_394577 [Protomyces lactucae-debilis]ORY78640.1 hypothetical protein BCR37DRAFT_394577 [Protomyces lactucae-debilis]